MIIVTTSFSKSSIFKIFSLQKAGVFELLLFEERFRKAPFSRRISVDGRSKGGEVRDTKAVNLSRNSSSLQVLVDVSRFSPYVINLSRNKNICCGLKKVDAKSRAWDNFEQQILALLLVFHLTHNLSRNKFAHVTGQVEGF